MRNIYLKSLTASIVLLALGFHLKAHVTLLYPQGGEIFHYGEVVEISWQEEVPHDPLNWDLYFSPDGGETWEILEEDLDYSMRSYYWNIPSMETSQGRIRIVQDNEVVDYDGISDDFEIQGNSTGTRDLAQYGISIFPNPASEHVQLSGLPHSTIALYDAEGKLMERKETAGGSESFPLADYPKGIYYIKIVTPTFSASYLVSGL